MTWTYRQASGVLEHDGELVAVGYAGHGEGLNRPELDHVPNTGPIPRGRWVITAVFDSEEHGPFCLRLAPLPATDTKGRFGFLMHGERRPPAPPGEASRGCLVFSRVVREAVWRSVDRMLEVVPT